MRNLMFVAILLPAAAAGQGFNVDFDVFDGGPIVGEGAPSDAFGAAANQPGRWNQLNASQHAPHRLLDITGQLTNVWLSRLGASQAGGWNNPLNTGDYGLLLNDAGQVLSSPVTWSLSGLASGYYDLYVYAVSPIAGNPAVPTEIFVPGSISQNPQLVTGPMPGNSFTYLVTHSLHRVEAVNGELSFLVTGRHPQIVSTVNGFQLVAVPEPISAIGLIAGFVVLAFGRQRKAN